MSAWQIGFVTVRTNGKTIKVKGLGELAERLRQMSDGDTVSVVPPPGGRVPLRADSDWLVDKWVREWALMLDGGPVATDYVPQEEDVPADARELLDARAGHVAVDGRIY